MHFLRSADCAGNREDVCQERGKSALFLREQMREKCHPAGEKTSKIEMDTDIAQATQKRGHMKAKKSEDFKLSFLRCQK